MKNKLSRFAVPYEVWMAIFVVAPIVIMVAYAFSSADGGFTMDNFVQMGGYTEVFLRSFKLAIIATVICLLIGYPVSYLMSRLVPVSLFKIGLATPASTLLQILLCGIYLKVLNRDPLLHGTGEPTSRPHQTI